MGPVKPTPENKWGAGTLAVHADDHLAASTDVAPPMHVSTTFAYPDDPNKLKPVAEWTSSLPEEYVYSRETAPNTTRLEAVLTALLGAPTVTYGSGLAALFAAYTMLRPRRAAITGGYHGAHGVLAIHTRLTGLEVVPLSVADVRQHLGPGDVVHVETPVNPTGEARDLAALVAAAREKGAVVLVDATFAPPPLQDPFALGADVVMHSGTKYIGGHSDMLCGVLATRNEAWLHTLREDRLHMGNVMGSLEGWLGVRSVRTLELRVTAQAASCEKLVAWLAAATAASSENDDGNDHVAKVVDKVSHASLQKDDMGWLRKQMPGGFGPVFAVTTHTVQQARRLPSKLRLFHHATSLGGVESLCEWRAMSDDTVDQRLLRFSIGVERWEDLKDDLQSAFKALVDEQV